jgi:hypothetical protein
VIARLATMEQNRTALIEETTNPPSIATSNEDNTGCSVCGFGLYVSKPEAIFAYPEQPASPMWYVTGKLD